jgi:hypothetical protein
MIKHSIGIYRTSGTEDAGTSCPRPGTVKTPWLLIGFIALALVVVIMLITLLASLDF